MSFHQAIGNDTAPGVKALGALLLLALACATAPRAGAQAGDVPYVPTPMNVVEAMLELARVGPQDFVMDLGSGDGRIVIVAAKKYGARGVGVELDGGLVSDARRAAQTEGVASRVEFRAENLFTTDIERATVLTSYLFPRINLELRPRIFSQLKPGSRVVSHEFDFGNWKPDAQVTVPVPDKPYGPPRSEVFLWIVPANAAGRWQWRATVDGTPLEIEVLLEQTFQELRGSATAAGRPARLQSARLRGEEIWLTLVADLNGRAVQHEFAGRIAGDRILGKARVPRGESGTEWQATRVTRGKINIDAASARPALAHELRKRGNS